MDSTSKKYLPCSTLAIAWNQLAYDIAFAEDEFLTFKGHRALAMMHLAIHDTLNTIDPVHERYIYSGKQISADPVAAASQAAYEVLVSQYPDQRAKLEQELGSWSSAVKVSTAGHAGIELGKAVAAAILADRAHDGWDVKGTYTFAQGVGEYHTTPPWNGFVLQPGFGAAKPFMLRSGNQFRPSPPPEVTSAAYAKAFNEVKAVGDVHSDSRGADQSHYAVWWMEFSEGSVNRLARSLLPDRRIDLWAANRVLARMNAALFDTYIAVWDSKYEYNHWRPYTAIREAGNDGNKDTVPDADWEPLRPTPPFPEYISAHAAGCAASFAILAEALGDETLFTMQTLTAPPEMQTRSFTSFSRAADECADSRVQLGWHFRYATREGLTLGSRVADFVLENSLRKAQ